MAKKPLIEILLPVYNEIASLPALIQELDRVRDTLQGRANTTYLFVNDGSTDGSREYLHRLAAERSEIRVLDLVHNFGHGAALACGIDHFNGDLLAIMDADLQDNPGALTAMFEAWEKGARTVVAQRASRKEATRFAFGAFYFLLRKMAQGLPPIDFGTQCLLDKSVVERLKQLPERNRYLPGLVAYSSGPIVSVPVDRRQRKNGKSRVGLWGLFHLATTALLSFSNVPIRLVSVFGIVCAGSALSAGVVFISIKVFTPYAIPGWASMMTALAFASGVQLLCLGLIGEYIARIYEEVKQRPLYIVEPTPGSPRLTSSPRSEPSSGTDRRPRPHGDWTI